MKILKCVFSFLNISSKMSLINFLHKLRPFSHPASIKYLQLQQGLSTTPLNDPNKPPTKPKTVPVPKITLIASDQVSITTLEEANKLAKRRALKLVKVIDVDTKSQRPVYKLMTGSEYYEEDLKRREEKKKEKLSNTSLKGEKVVLINSKIYEHDLQVHINRISKWLGKRYEVRIVINGDAQNMEKAEGVYQGIEKQMKDVGRILQKRTKGNDIRFQIIPLKSNEPAAS